MEIAVYFCMSDNQYALHFCVPNDHFYAPDTNFSCWPNGQMVRFARAGGIKGRVCFQWKKYILFFVLFYLPTIIVS